MTSICTSAELTKTVILDTSEMSDDLQVAIDRFEKKHFGSVVSKLTRDQTFDIICAIVDDVLNARLKWAKNIFSQYDALDKHITWTLSPKNIKYRNMLYQQIVDAFEITIHSRLDMFMDRHTWDIWSMKRIGKDIALIRGIDYRIFDWERRMASGEWKDEEIHS